MPSFLIAINPQIWNISMVNRSCIKSICVHWKHHQQQQHHANSISEGWYRKKNVCLYRPHYIEYVLSKCKQFALQTFVSLILWEFTTATKCQITNSNAREPMLQHQMQLNQIRLIKLMATWANKGSLTTKANLIKGPHQSTTTEKKTIKISKCM